MGWIGRWGCGALILVAATTGPALGEEPKPAEPPIGPVPAPGNPILFVWSEETNDTDPTMEKLRELGPKSGIDIPVTRPTTVEMEFGLEVLERLPAGGFRATLRFGRVQATGLGLMGKDPPKYSSDAPLPTEQMDKLLFPRIVHFGNAVLQATLDSGGSVTAVEGCEAAAEARVLAMKLSKDDAFWVRGTLKSEEAARVVNTALVVTPLPARALGKSASWTTDDLGEYIEPGTDMGFRQTLRVTEVRADALRLEGGGKVEPRTSPLLKKIGLAMQKPRIKSSKVESRFDLSRADGLPTSGDQTATVNYTTGDSGMEKIKTVKTTLRRVAAWPSGKPAIPAPGAPPPK